MLTLLLSTAFAEEPAAAVEEAPTDEELHELEARALYKVALELMDLGQYPEARIVLTRIGTDYGDSAIAPKAAEMYALLDTMEPAGRDEAARARAELAIDQALASAAFFGFLVPASTFQPSEPLVPVTMGLAGLGAGIGGGLYLGRSMEPSQGQVMSLFTGEWLGAANGLALSAVNPPRDYRGVYRYTTAGFVAGAASGLAVAHYVEPTGGQVAMVNSGAMYGAYLTGWSFAYWYEEDRRWSDERRVFVRMAVGTDLGAALGAVAAWRFPVSRGRMNVINLAALTGTAAAAGVAFLVDYYSYGFDVGPTGAMIMSGSALGFGTGVLLTMRMDGGREVASASGVLLERRDGRWAVGVPSAVLLPDPEGGLGVSVAVARGRF